MELDNLYIDYETYWGTKYSLRTQGMSDTDYILDEKFQIHGASVAFNDGPVMFLNFGQLKAMFNVIDPSEYRFISHRVLFDGMITTLIFKKQFTEYYCTLAALDAIYQGGISVGLDEAMKLLLGMEGKTEIIGKLKDVRTEDITPEAWAELTAYADEDLIACRRLHKEWGPYLSREEHQIMDLILKMFVRPLLEFDEVMLREAVQEADDDRESRIANALALGATVEILKGNKLFPDFLRERGIDVPMKKNPKGKMIPAFAKTDKGFQDMLESKDDEIRHLAIGRLAVKSTQAQTRAYRFLKLHEELGVLPVAYNYARAHTWRLSGGNKINMANLKRKSKLRTCVQAPKGFVMGVADASQIECRLNAYVAGQETLLDLFRRGEDPYNDMATDIFNRPIDRKHQDEDGEYPDFFEGFLGKTATLGLGFQMGGPKFANTVVTKAKVDLGMDVEYTEAEGYRVVSLYRSKNWKIEEMWGHCKNMLFDMLNNLDSTWEFADGSLEIRGRENKIYFPNGTWLYYPMLQFDEGGFTYMVKQGKRYLTKYIYGGLLCENIIQHAARNVTSRHMTQIAERYPIVMHTYDENIALIPEAEAEEGTQWMIDIMKVPPNWCASIPLDAEGGFAREYSK